MPEQESNKSNKHKLRWYQYRLSTLMFIVIPVCAIVCTFYRMKADEAERQRLAVKAIQESGGMIYYDYEIDDVGYTIPEIKQELPGPDFLHEDIKRDWSNIGGLGEPCLPAAVRLFRGCKRPLLLILFIHLTSSTTAPVDCHTDPCENMIGTPGKG